MVVAYGLIGAVIIYLHPALVGVSQSDADIAVPQGVSPLRLTVNGKHFKYQICRLLYDQN